MHLSQTKTGQTISLYMYLPSFSARFRTDPLSKSSYVDKNSFIHTYFDSRYFNIFSGSSAFPTSLLMDPSNAIRLPTLSRASQDEDSGIRCSTDKSSRKVSCPCFTAAILLITYFVVIILLELMPLFFEYVNSQNPLTNEVSSGSHPCNVFCKPFKVSLTPLLSVCLRNLIANFISDF